MDIVPSDELPDEVTKLGKPLAVFHGDRLVMALCWIFGVGAVLAGLLGLGWFGILLMEAPGRGAGAKVPGKLIFVGIVALSAGIGLIRKARAAQGVYIFVCTDGVAVRGRKGQTTVMRWEDINIVKRSVDAKNQKLTIATSVQLILKDRLDRELLFNETVAGFRDLRQMIEEHTLKFMFPAALAAFQDGAVIGFGDVSVSSEGIHKGRDTLPWDLFERAEVAKGRLLLYSRGKKRPFGKAELTEVPNIHVLLALAEHVGERGS